MWTSDLIRSVLICEFSPKISNKFSGSHACPSKSHKTGSFLSAPVNGLPQGRGGGVVGHNKICLRTKSQEK